jgi:hypothetical protein
LPLAAGPHGQPVDATSNQHGAVEHLSGDVSSEHLVQHMAELVLTAIQL